MTRSKPMLVAHFNVSKSQRSRFRDHSNNSVQTDHHQIKNLFETSVVLCNTDTNKLINFSQSYALQKKSAIVNTSKTNGK